MFKLSDVPGMILDSMRDPQESAARILSIAPPRSALWLALALVAVLSTLMSQIALLLSGGVGDPAMGDIFGSPVITAGLQAFFIVLTVYVVFWVGKACGGVGSFEETLLIIVWLQVVFLAVQLAQLVLAIVAPFISFLVLVASVCLFFYLLTYFILVLHRFTSAGMVLVGIILTSLGVAVVMGMVLTALGLAPVAMPAGGAL